MKRILLAVAVLAAFVAGYVLGFSRPRSRTAMDAFKDDVRQIQAAASLGSDVLEKLEAGDIDGAKHRVAPPIATYYEVHRHFADPSPYQQQLVRHIESIIPKSAVLREAIEDEKSSGRSDTAKELLQSQKAPEKPK